MYTRLLNKVPEEVRRYLHPGKFSLSLQGVSGTNGKIVKLMVPLVQGGELVERECTSVFPSDALVAKLMLIA